MKAIATLIITAICYMPAGVVVAAACLYITNSI